MAFQREDAPPHVHHLELVSGLTVEIRRHLQRLGMLRGLTTVRVGANGCYRISVVPAAEVRLDTLLDLGVGACDALALLDDVFDYDPGAEAAVLVVESNPVDGAVLSFVVQDLALAR